MAERGIYRKKEFSLSRFYIPFPAVTDLRSRSHGWDYIEQNMKFRKEIMIEREKKRTRNQMKER
jgi:hypothetical protein